MLHLEIAAAAHITGPAGFLWPAEVVRRRALAVKARLGVAMASLAVIAALFSCWSQLQRWSVTTNGVIMVWPIIGLAFASIKVGVLMVDRSLGRQQGWTRNLLVSGTLVLTNLALCAMLIHCGVAMWDWTTAAMLGLWGIGLTTLIWHWRHDTHHQRLVRIGTWVNVMPVYLQALSYLLHGAEGMPGFNLFVLQGLSLCMFASSAWPFDHGLSGADRREAFREGRFAFFRLTRRDLLAQSAMSAAWLGAGSLGFALTWLQ